MSEDIKHSKTSGYDTIKSLAVKLGLTVNRLRSDTTFRRILHRLDFHLLAQQFGQWVKGYIELESDEWVAIDGKSIKGTVNDAQTANPKLRQFDFSL